MAMVIAAGLRPCICRKKGHSVAIVDNFARRQWDHELGVANAHPDPRLARAADASGSSSPGKTIELFVGDVTDYDFLGIR